MYDFYNYSKDYYLRGIDISDYAIRNAKEEIRQFVSGMIYGDKNLDKQQQVKNGIFHSIREYEADKIYLCFDYKKSWRKEYTAIYKAHRKEVRDKQASIIDWVEFYKFTDTFKEELKI